MRLTCHRREEGLVCGNVCLNQRVVEKGGGCVTAVYEWIRNLVAFFLFLSVMENLLPGQKYGKYIRLFAGMVLILLVAEPFTSGFDLEEVLARSYENLCSAGRPENCRMIWERKSRNIWAGYFPSMRKRSGRIYRNWARSCGLDLSECSVHIENNENSPQFGTVQSIFAVLPQQSGETEKEKLSNKIQEYYGLEERYVEIEIAGGEGSVDFSSDGGGDPVYSGIPGGK